MTPPKLVALGLMMIIALGGVGWWRYSRNADRRRGEDVSEKLVDAVQHGESIPVEALTEFDFDRLMVLHGTSSAEDIDRALGFEWRRSDDEGYECCDPAPLWLFVKGDEVAAYLRPPIQASYGDCVGSGRSYRPASRLRLRGCRAAKTAG